MRAVLILAFVTLLAVLSMPGAAMAHGSDDPVRSADCPGCPQAEPAEDTADIVHGCPHLTGCAAMVLSEPESHLPALSGQRPRHGRPDAEVLAGRDGLIDPRPPRRRA